MCFLWTVSASLDIVEACFFFSCCVLVAYFMSKCFQPVMIIGVVNQEETNFSKQHQAYMHHCAYPVLVVLNFFNKIEFQFLSCSYNLVSDTKEKRHVFTVIILFQ